MRAVFQDAGITSYTHGYDAATLAAALAIVGSGYTCQLLAADVINQTTCTDPVPRETPAQHARRTSDQRKWTYS